MSRLKQCRTVKNDKIDKQEEHTFSCTFMAIPLCMIKQDRNSMIPDASNVGSVYPELGGLTSPR